MEQSALAQTLDCGQCFRWNEQPDGSFSGMAGSRFLQVSVKTLPEIVKDDFWSRYFDMDLDYAKIRADFCKLNPALDKAVRFAPKIRILNQEPWETLCSFIISQCNNIGRIKGIVARLCGAFGEPAGGGNYAFPSAERLAQVKEEDLRRLGCGFRDKYILDAAKKTAAGKIDFQNLKKMPLGEARNKLMTIDGVGPKVADCVLLYGLHRLDAFPVDVWMKRAMKTMFPGKTPEYFGRYAGIAQQYIFYYSRNHPEIFTAMDISPASAAETINNINN